MSIAHIDLSLADGTALRISTDALQSSHARLCDDVDALENLSDLYGSSFIPDELFGRVRDEIGRLVEIRGDYLDMLEGEERRRAADEATGGPSRFRIVSPEEYRRRVREMPENKSLAERLTAEYGESLLGRGVDLKTHTFGVPELKTERFGAALAAAEKRLRIDQENILAAAMWPKFTLKITDLRPLPQFDKVEFYQQSAIETLLGPQVLASEMTGGGSAEIDREGVSQFCDAYVVKPADGGRKDFDDYSFRHDNGALMKVQSTPETFKVDCSFIVDLNFSHWDDAFDGEPEIRFSLREYRPDSPFADPAEVDWAQSGSLEKDLVELFEEAFRSQRTEKAYEDWRRRNSEYRRALHENGLVDDQD